MKNRFVVFGMVLMALFSLVACNSGANDDTNVDLVGYKTEARAELGRHAIESDYSVENWGIVCGIVDEACAAINNAKDIATIDSVVESSIAEINEIPKKQANQDDGVRELSFVSRDIDLRSNDNMIDTEYLLVILRTHVELLELIDEHNFCALPEYDETFFEQHSLVLYFLKTDSFNARWHNKSTAFEKITLDEDVLTLNLYKSNDEIPILSKYNSFFVELEKADIDAVTEVKIQHIEQESVKSIIPFKLSDKSLGLNSELGYLLTAVNSLAELHELGLANASYDEAFFEEHSLIIYRFTTLNMIDEWMDSEKVNDLMTLIIQDGVLIPLLVVESNDIPRPPVDATYTILLEVEKADLSDIQKYWSPFWQAKTD